MKEIMKGDTVFFKGKEYKVVFCSLNKVKIVNEKEVHFVSYHSLKK